MRFECVPASASEVSVWALDDFTFESDSLIGPDTASPRSRRIGSLSSATVWVHGVCGTRAANHHAVAASWFQPPISADSPRLPADQLYRFMNGEMTSLLAVQNGTSSVPSRSFL
jgi:hypothetical protein